ncbi:hypothetical protein E0H86_04105 [Acinetobacter sp. ANC 4635]|uniref:hypothetical protein n=1 Tax=Acinetobacter sp. ANC 4635 TaxID=2529846 RepID=UPI00103CB5F6|nr:hypothetical protein [Acinetobacter sp. ANC 4635]TCB32649.1 hypothetical protein E0H86_04105 [Acinetobacter sp. ANC 4635]
MSNAANNTCTILYKNEKNNLIINRENKSRIFLNCLEYLYNKYDGKYESVFNKRLPQKFFYDDGFTDFISNQIIEESWNNKSVNDLLYGLINKFEVKGASD